MKALRIVLMTVLAVALFGGTAFGAGVVLRHYQESPSASAGGRDAEEQQPEAPAAPPSENPSTPAPADPSTPAPPATPPGPTYVLEPGDNGEQVRDLQHRLFQLAWLPELTTGTYDAATREAVSGFQGKRGFARSGSVDDATWKKLVEMTRAPSHDEKHNILKPGPTLLGPGAQGDGVRDLQARLRQIAWYSGDISGSYDTKTTESVRGFQTKRAIPVTGDVDQRTMDRLVAMTTTPSHDEKHNIKPKPGALHPSCLTGRALCVDKSRNNLRWVVDGQVRETFDVRFGSDELPTREGHFAVQRKSRDHVSSLYDTPMPFAMFFSGGQAVHYSPDFAAQGYSGASHGCVNVRDYHGIKRLFDQVNIGDKVIVYWS